MPTLSEVITSPDKRPAVIKDCGFLIDDEVKKKGGLSGAAIKMAFAAVKAVKPGFISEAIDHMLDDFARRLEPFYDAYKKDATSGTGPGHRSLPDHLSTQGPAVADALLGITDDRAARAKNAMVKKTYEKLRPSAKKHVEEAVPGIGRLIEKHTAT